MMIQMKDTCRTSEDGHTTRRLYDGCMYDIADCAARALINEGRAEAVEDDDHHPRSNN